ncbi:MAG TPA: ammonia-forming cytochrome c nitrite reductase subunit c552 [Pseudomonadales bacterium]|nr:ammonia-forming cytochrome c nitrite reductase subunit c552 [Pseudomonadales bacterium]
MHRALLFICLALLLCACDNKHPATVTEVQSTLPPKPAAPVASPASTYVGSAACQFCHTLVYQDWLQSDHHQAMMPVNDKSVRGNFAGQTLNHHNQTTLFTRGQDSRYTIATDTNTATPAELTLQYTFGIFPLQQYLTTLPDGRLQSLPFAWDTRSASDGGQHWFHLYANEKIMPGDVLHWQSPSHNANHMCLECHTTNFEKKFDATSGQFHSQWQETGIGCESCHGPGSSHINWAKSANKNSIANKGWEIALTSGDVNLWQHQTESGKARRLQPGDDSQVERCAQCHSRRSRISKNNNEKNLLDAFTPALLDESLYHPDGQIQDEVYEYGSFMQSRMHEAGVTCSNCHNPHSGKTRIEGNGLCLQCHNASYDSEQHHLHKIKTTGSYCVDCHMPTTTYMGVDKRRDHSLRIPRPDLSEKIASPNACTQCHNNKTAAWATKILSGKFGSHWQQTHYGEIIQQARMGEPAVYDAIAALINDNKNPAIVRATAVSLLPNFHTRDYRQLLDLAAHDNNGLIRLGAARAAESLPAADASILKLLLQDKLLAIRIEAARVLGNIPDVQQDAAYQQARQEYIQSQTINSDRAPSLVNLSSLAIREQRWDDAENLLLDAIRKEPYYIPASVNLADFYRLRGRDPEGKNILEHAIAQVPDNADLQLSLGLWLIRNQQTAAAAEHLRLAASLSRDPYFHYVYALSLQQEKPDQALAELDKAAALPAYNRDVQIARVDLAWQHKEKQRAEKALAEWEKRDPQDPAIIEWEKIFKEK